MLNLKVDTVITLSTLSGQKKGSFPSIPDSKPFPLKYMDNFNGMLFWSTAIIMHVRVLSVRGVATGYSLKCQQLEILYHELIITVMHLPIINPVRVS